MTHVALTGGDGFLGWHTRCAAMAASTKTVHIPVGDGFSVDAAAAAISGSSRFLHIAGVNRGSDEEVHVGNVLRKLFHTAVVDIRMDATRPGAVDVPTMWAHRISNAGLEDFRSAFWSNEVFDPSDPDAFPEEV
jgi:hypothetical protein